MCLCHEWIHESLLKTFKVSQHLQLRKIFHKQESGDIQVVKEVDLKSIGFSPRRLDPYSTDITLDISLRVFQMRSACVYR